MNTKLPEGGLQRLIQDRKRDLSYARLSQACGGVPTVGNLQRLAKNHYETFPSAEVMQGLAKGLGVRAVDVLHAAAISVGLSISHADTDDLIIPGAGKLPAQSQQVILSMAENMLWWQEQSGESSNVVPLHGDYSEDAERLVADTGDHDVAHDQLPHD